MTGYLDKIRPHERRRILEIDAELFALRARSGELVKERAKLVSRAGCRVTYERVGMDYWRGRRAARASSC